MGIATLMELALGGALNVVYHCAQTDYLIVQHTQPYYR